MPVALDKALPFNKKTIAAMHEARTQKLKSFDSVEALMADLHGERKQPNKFRRLNRSV